MWRSLWRSTDRFSLQHFKYIINDLQKIKVVNSVNREVVIDILQSIAEIVTYGDKHDPSIFECFMEHQVLAEFLRLLKASKNSWIEAPLLQYLSIMIQNLQSDQAIYYCFSNEYINCIITHEYNFDAGDVAPYYVSFLRTVSSKVNRDTLCLLVKVEEDRVVSFPLYSEALRFAHHGEKMIQTAIRALTLSIYNVSDDMVYQFITTSSVSEYFGNLVLSLRNQCLQLDTVVTTVKDCCIGDKKNALLFDIDKFLDDLYYIKDLLCVGESRLSGLVIQKMLGLLVVPIVVPLMHFNTNNVINISAITSFYILSRIVQVVDRKEVLNSIASLILYPHLVSSSEIDEPSDTSEFLNESDPSWCINQISASSHNLKQIKKYLSFSLPSAEDDQKHWLRHAQDPSSSDKYPANIPLDSLQRDRIGIMAYIFSDDEVLLLASLMLLLILSESKERLICDGLAIRQLSDYLSWVIPVYSVQWPPLFCQETPFILLGDLSTCPADDLDCLLSSAIGFSQTMIKTEEASTSSIFLKCMPEIFNALLKQLGSSATSSVYIQLQAGWFLQKLISLQRATLSHQELHLFNVRIQLNASFHQSREQLLNEFRGPWFDHIPDTFKKEWATCKMVLKETSQNKDPFFILDLSSQKETISGSEIYVWKRMVDAVKVFVLHLHLKAYVLNGRPPDDPTINLKSKSFDSPRRMHLSDASSANFGSEVPIGSGFPCKIAFSKAGVHDIFVIPVSKGIVGKLLLVEKHPFHSRSGIVIAKAPLAGLSPKIDENHETWLHLCIREPNPKQVGKKSDTPTTSKYDDAAAAVAAGRWTLGFPDAETCKAAYASMTEETCKQRSFVEKLLAPFLYDAAADDDNK